MRSGTERCKFFFNQRKHLFDRGPFRLPCEMKCHGRSLVAWADPKVICRDRSELRDEEVGHDLVAQLLNGEYCSITLIAGDEVLRLQLCATAWRKVHAKVGKPFVPGT